MNGPNNQVTPGSRISPAAMSLGAALLAGLIAILLNTALLHLADLIPLKVQGGGLLTLLQLVFGGLVARTSMPTLCCH